MASPQKVKDSYHTLLSLIGTLNSTVDHSGSSTELGFLRGLVGVKALFEDTLLGVEDESELTARVRKAFTELSSTRYNVLGRVDSHYLSGKNSAFNLYENVLHSLI